MKAYFLAGCVCFAIWCAVVSGLCALIASAVTDDWSLWQAFAFAIATGLLFVPYVTVLAYRESKIRTHDQEVIATIASEALRAGKPVVAFVDDEGNLRMRPAEFRPLGRDSFRPSGASLVSTISAPSGDSERRGRRK